jgi:hypothetical protein
MLTHHSRWWVNGSRGTRAMIFRELSSNILNIGKKKLIPFFKSSRKITVKIINNQEKEKKWILKVEFERSLVHPFVFIDVRMWVLFHPFLPSSFSIFCVKMIKRCHIFIIRNNSASCGSHHHNIEEMQI